MVADLHCGSVFGLLPPDFLTSDGRPVTLNTGQKYLWECWRDAALRMAPLDALVCNGDLIDGSQRRSEGTELCLPLLEDQSEAAVQALRHMIDATGKPPVYVVAGTEYHTSKAAREEEIVAQRLKAVRYQGAGTGRYCREILDLDVDGIILNFAHGISVASGLYRATPPDREAVWSALAGKAGKAPRAECVIRSHAHNFVHVEHQSKHGVISPCWQLQTRYMRKNSAYRLLPDVGYLLIKVRAAARDEGEDPCQIVKKIYPLPAPPVTRLCLPQTSGNSSIRNARPGSTGPRKAASRSSNSQPVTG